MLGTAPITTSYFGLTIESYDYNYSYLGGPVEAFPAIPVGVVRSWDVWSPNSSKIEYMDWSNLNPAAGVYNWTALNTWIAANQANNTPMVYTFGDPPAWAGGTTTNLADFQAFVTAIVTQANGAIKYWEGFNEFDVSGMSPALVAQLQGIIYNTVHTLDPGALVLSPTVSGAGSDGDFAQFLADGGGKYFDIAAFHGYNNATGEGIVPVVQDFQAVLAQYGLSNVPIWDTEWGMEAPTVITDTTAQEAYVSTGLILQAATGVQTEMFYAYDNANSALYNTATGQLTAAGVAYEETAQWLNGATEPSGYQVNGSVYTDQLIKNSQSDLLVWNASGQSSFAAGAYTQYVDTQGVVHAITNGTVTIGSVPILLETPVTNAPPSAPSITSFSPDSATVGDGITNATTLTLTGAGATNSTVTVFDGSTQLGTASVSASGVWSFVTATLAAGAHSFTATDTAAGAASTASAALTVTIDTAVPPVTSVVATGSGITNGNGDLNAGHVVALTLSLSEAVTVANGTPTLSLSDGATATYSGGSGSSALTFNYTVAAGQNTSDLAVTAVNLGTATITDVAGNAASLAGAVTNPTGILKIDTILPAVASVVATGSGITSGTGDLDAGHVVALTLNLSEVVTVANGTPTLTLSDGATASYSGGSGTNALTFSYTVAAGQNISDLAVAAVNLGTATITDVAGNTANLSSALTNPAGTLKIDTTAPTVTSVVANGSGITSGTGDLDAGHVVTLTLGLSEAVSVANGTPTLTLNDGATATYSGGSGSNTLTFSYTVTAGQNTSDLAVTALNLSTATITDAAGNGANLAGAVTNPAGTLKIDTTPPIAPVIIGDITNSNDSVTLTGTAEASTTVTVHDGQTLFGTTTANANGDWSFTTPTLGNGVQTFTATAADSAGNISNTSSPFAVTIFDRSAPTITSASSSNNGIVTLAGIGAGNATVSVYDGQTLLGVTTSSINGAWNFTTPTLTNGVQTFTAIDANSFGNISETSSPFAVTVDIPATPVITGIVDLPSNAIETFGDVVTLIINFSEAVTIAGGALTLSLNDGATASYSGGSGTNALAFAYTVASGQNTDDLTVTVINLNAATVKANSGISANLSLEGLIQSGPQIDTTPPAPPIIVSDIINSNSSVTLAGTADPDDTVTLYDGQAIGTTTTSADGTWSFTTPVLDNGGQLFTATATDSSGKVSKTSSPFAVTIDNPSDITFGENIDFSSLSFAAGDHPVWTQTSGDQGTLSVDSADNSVLATVTVNGIWDSQDFAVTSDGSGGVEVTVKNPPPPAATSAVIIMQESGTSNYEIYDIGQNSSLAAYPLGQIPEQFQAVGLGDFNSTDSADIMARNSSTGAFAIYDLNNNNITGSAPIGQVGMEWSIAGFADFSGNAHETDMLLRSTNGSFELYDVANNQFTGFQALGQVGPEWQVAGFGDFSGDANETDMLMRNSATGAFELYDINNGQYTGFHFMGQVGSEWNVVGFGDFSGNANETDMLMRNSNTGSFELYDISNNQLTGFHAIGQVGPEWSVAGFGDFSGNANEADLLMRDNSTGTFELFDISNNQISGARSLGQVDPTWLVQAIASLPSSGAGTAAPVTPSSGSDQSQQGLLTTPHTA